MKLRTFFRSVRLSLLKPDYYTDVLKAPFSFSFKYFAFLFFLIGFLTVGASLALLSNSFWPFINQFQKNVDTIYPENLQVTVKNGLAQTNVSEPYFIPVRANWFPRDIAEAIKNQPLQNLLVVDTKASPTDISKYQTIALLTKDSLAINTQESEIRIQSLKRFGDFTLDKKSVDGFLNKFIPYLNWLLAALIVLSLLIFPLAIIGFKFVYLLIFSLIGLILSRLFNLNLTYKKVLQINLHAITLPTFIIAIFELFNTSSRMPFFETIILVIFNLVIFASLRESSTFKPH